MIQRYDLSQLEWKLAGWIPHLWEFQPITQLDEARDAKVVCPAKVPGSVQYSLKLAGLLPDWNVGLEAQKCEWVENRQWMYETVLPDSWIDERFEYRLDCLGLDYSGTVFLNGQTVATFCGTHVPHTFDLTPHLVEGHNVLRIVFDPPPRWLGQFGYTSKMTEWKVRFNYTWDWMPRLVQIGIWDSITLAKTDGHEIEEFRCVADFKVSEGTGILRSIGRVSFSEGAVVRITLLQGDTVIRAEQTPAAKFNAEGMLWQDLPVELWWPNLEGEQPLYKVQCTLLDAKGGTQDTTDRQVGFRNITWAPCEGAPEAADPWICVVNGRPIFLQGVNFPPILPNFADATEQDYQKRLQLYRDLGMNVLRINACGFLEKACFYELCDEMGLLVWQEFPLTSSGVDNIPPADEKSIQGVSNIARSFIKRRQNHPSLLLWSGGNELIDHDWRPIDTSHPMLGALERIVTEEDPTRRFIPASPSGPKFGADPEAFGQGLHWDVHGPWSLESDLESWTQYWQADDALFRSEIGSPGAAPAEIIHAYLGDCHAMPIRATNPYWRRPVAWWLEDQRFEAEHGRPPSSVEEYVSWSQQRQAEALVIAVKACKDRFPRCGGAILWCGHDCFPCATNTSIIDFHGNPKPAALALEKVYKSPTFDQSRATS
jgi:beta-mannosidase